MTGKALRRACIGMALLLAAAPATAQRADTTLTRAFQRAELAVPSLTGPVVGQEQGRHTVRGALTGGVAGGLIGLGIGGFIALYCTSTQTDECLGVVPVLTVLGVAGGAAAGAIVGAAIPRAAPDSAAEESASPAGRPKPVGGVGSASLQAVATGARMDGAGGADARRRTAGGAGVRLNLLAELKPWLAVGPEVGQVWLGDEAGSIRHVTAAFHGRWPLGRVAPYAIADLGLYQWTGESREYLGGGVGAGVRYATGDDGRRFLDLSGRWQQNAQNIEHVRSWSLAFGMGVRW